MGLNYSNRGYQYISKRTQIWRVGERVHLYLPSPFCPLMQKKKQRYSIQKQSQSELSSPERRQSIGVQNVNGGHWPRSVAEEQVLNHPTS